MTKRQNNYEFHSPRRGETLITPCKRVARSSGYATPPSHPAPRRGATSTSDVALLRSARERETILPRAAHCVLARGYSHGTPTVCGGGD